MSMFDHKQLHNAMNRSRSKSLFHEYDTTGEHVILTLNQPDLPYPCLRKLFVSMTVDDPSEATFAETVFGDIGFWQKLRAAPFIEEVIEDWQLEATIKRKSKAFEYVINEVKNDGKNGYAAAKFLIEEPWKPRTKAATKAKQETTKASVPSHIVDLTAEIKRRKA